LKELERKWGSCLQLGAQASVEVQQAAKLVVAENNFLRKLLEEHGLNKDYVDKQIHQFRQGQPTNSTVEEEASPSSVSHAHLCAAVSSHGHLSVVPGCGYLAFMIEC